MTTVDAANSSLEDARESLYEALQSRDRKMYHRAVRRSQEAPPLAGPRRRRVRGGRSVRQLCSGISLVLSLPGTKAC